MLHFNLYPDYYYPIQNEVGASRVHAQLGKLPLP